MAQIKDNSKKRKRSGDGSSSGNHKRFNKKMKKVEENLPDDESYMENIPQEENADLEYESLGNASSAIDFYNAVDPAFLKFLSSAQLGNHEENMKKKKKKDKKKKSVQIDEDEDVVLNDEEEVDEDEFYSLPIKKPDGTWTRKVIESDLPEVDIHTKFDDELEARKKKHETTRQIKLQNERYNQEDIMEEDNNVISDDNILEDSDDELTVEQQEKIYKIKQEEFKSLHIKYIREMPEEKKVQRELKMKRHIAKISTQILTDPGQHANLLKSLVELCSDPDEFVQKLAIISLCALFQDIVPSYKINEHQYDNESKLSREVEQIKNFEVHVLQSYQKYLQLLHSKVKNSKTNSTQTSIRYICLHCLCDLLKMLHHFNYAENIAEILLKVLNSNNDTLRLKAFDTIRTVFKNDQTFEISAYIVESIAHLAKKKEYNVKYEVIGCLLSLPLTNQLKDKFLPKDIATSKRKKGKKKFSLNVETALQKEKKSELINTSNDHLKLQTLILRNIVVTYVRLLKSDYKSPLLFSSLEGLSKFAHLLNVELIYDLLSYIRLLMQSLSDDIPLRTLLQLLCTVAQLTRGMGETINIDMTSTFNQLYNALLKVVLFEQEDLVTPKLLIQAISMMIFQTSQTVPPQRAAAIIKRLSTCILSSQSHLAVPLLFLMNGILAKHPRCRELLSTESFGISEYRFDAENPDHANALSTNLWEFHLLSRSIHPHISRFSQKILDIHSKRVVTQEDLKIMKDLSLEEYDKLMETYTFNGKFFPEPKEPKKDPEDLKFRKRSVYSIHKSSQFFKDCYSQLDIEEKLKDPIIVKTLGLKNIITKKNKKSE